jgi:hypothetical protein
MGNDFGVSKQLTLPVVLLPYVAEMEQTLWTFTPSLWRLQLFQAPKTKAAFAAKVVENPLGRGLSVGTRYLS